MDLKIKSVLVGELDNFLIERRVSVESLKTPKVELAEAEIAKEFPTTRK